MYQQLVSEQSEKQQWISRVLPQGISTAKNVSTLLFAKKFSWECIITLSRNKFYVSISLIRNWLVYIALCKKKIEAVALCF
jgi:hypothetical protein